MHRRAAGHVCRAKYVPKARLFYACFEHDCTGGSKDQTMSVYMVFPYMDHDLAGLLENERVKMLPSQIKLYMKQLLEGTEYLHMVYFSTLFFVSFLTHTFSCRIILSTAT